MTNPSVKSGITQEVNLAFALWVSPDTDGGSGAWDAKNSVFYPKFGTLNSTTLGTSGKNGLASTASNCGIAVGGVNNHTGTPFDFVDTTWTILTLLRPISTGSPVIFQNQDAWSPNYGYQITHGGTFVDAAFRGDSARILAASSSGVSVLNQVLTLATVCDASSLKILKNGTQVATTSHTQTLVDYTGTAIRIAGLFNTAAAKGSSAVPVEIFAILGWNVALTPAEIQSFGTTEAGFLAGDFYSTAFEFGGGSTTYSLTLDAGSYAITGQSILSNKTLSLRLDSGVYNITGQDVPLLQEGSYRLTLDAGIYNITGQDPNVGLSMLLGAGTYSMFGSNIRLTSSQEPVLISKSQSTISISIRMGL